jgi:hypothetical protein
MTSTSSSTSPSKANLDITWLRDGILEDLDNLPAPRSSRARSSRTSLLPWSSSRPSAQRWSPENR